VLTHIFDLNFYDEFLNCRTYLLAIDGGNTCFNTEQTAAILNVNSNDLMKKYDNKGSLPNFLKAKTI
jgi:hypothetical protein